MGTWGRVYIGEGRGARKRNCSLWGSEENAKGKLLERSFPLDTLQELSKRYIYQSFLKVLGILKPFFQEGFKPPEAVPPLPYKPKFEEP
jgi:hypothetical protein